MNILFLNNTKKNCGVYQYGIRLFNILKKSKDISLTYGEVENAEEYKRTISENRLIKAIIYNYHCIVMPWLNHSTIQRLVINIGIPHESPDDLFDIVCNIDPNAQETHKKFSLPRPIFENVEDMLKDYVPSSNSVKDFIEYSEPNIPVFGSFGFGFDNKGFDRIVRLINEQYDKAIIKFAIPVAYYDPNDGINTTQIARQKCIESNKKDSIKLLFIHEFLSTEDILKFLSSTTMNIFLYDMLNDRGISSAIDYALSVKRPLGISNSNMFRNIFSNTICLYNTSIEDCLKNSSEYCERFIKLYSHDNMISKFRKICQSLSKSYSQTSQDIFVLSILNKKYNGTFLEIGSNHPVTNSNTYLLESDYGWKGLMIEYDATFSKLYDIYRPGSVYSIGDARKVEYENLLISHKFPQNIDYLQIDLDVDNRSTLEVLLLLDNNIFDKYKFATVTFEHDIYRGNYFDTRRISRQIFTKRGYVLVFPDVSVYWEGGYKKFEDWYVHPSLVDMEYVDRIKTSDSIHHNKIGELLKNNSI